MSSHPAHVTRGVFNNFPRWAPQLPAMGTAHPRRAVRYERELAQTDPQDPGRRTMPDVTSLRPDDPRRVGRYRLTGRIDEFARGDAAPTAVFLAQRMDGETVMVTLLAADRAADAAARDRFAA